MIQTDEQRRASLSYLLGWVDALSWATANLTGVDQLQLAAHMEDRQRALALAMQASDLYDSHGAAPEKWVELLENDPEQAERILSLCPEGWNRPD